MIDLRELMAERSADAAPSGDRLAEVQRRIAVRRRRHAVLTVAGAVTLVAGMATYVAVPGGQPAGPPTFAAGSATPSASPPASPKPVAGGKVGPFAEYARGYRVVAFGKAPVSSKKVEFTWAVNAADVAFLTYCPGLPKDTTLDLELAIDGSDAGYTTNCNSELHNDPDPYGGLRGYGSTPRQTAPKGASIGDTVTVAYSVTGAQRNGYLPKIPTEGTIYVAVAEKVPFEQYPFPARPAKPAPPEPDGMASEPGTKVVHSDPADPNTPVSTTLTWHRSFEYMVVPQTPGIYRVSVNGVPAGGGEVYDYSGNGPNSSCQVKRADKGHCLLDLESLKDGDTVTVTVTAEHATGPWLAELRSEWQDPSARG
ncbi:hypothetical protein ABZ570_07255 [Micromonospora sp. NPDC007271]|uniref:hypothetical protein n=1 Tax=Micromonospora sp. NPDC007271 TaxID=3154587 RepID=UPI0033E80551